MADTSLQNFMENYRKAEADLAWIRIASGHEYIEDIFNNRFRREVGEEGPISAFASFDLINFFPGDPVPQFIEGQESGDAWYSQFRTTECQHGNCKFTDNSKKKKKSSKARVSKKHKSMTKKGEKSRNRKVKHKDTMYDYEYKYSDPEYDEYESFGDPALSKKSDEKSVTELEPKEGTSQNAGDSWEYNPQPYNHRENTDASLFRGNGRSYPANLPSTLTDPTSFSPGSSFYNTSEARDAQSFLSNPPHLELKDQLEQTKNDLSHEADYKLSKIEQEAMDRRYKNNVSLYGFDPFATNPYSKPRLNTQGRLGSYNPFPRILKNEKRSVDPVNEIKLKVSDRLISRGLGPSLPSDALDGRTSFISVDDILQNQNHERLPNEDEYFVKTSSKIRSYGQDTIPVSRKLLQVEIEEPRGASKRRGRRSLKESDNDTLVLLLDQKITEDLNGMGKVARNVKSNSSSQAIKINFDVSVKTDTTTTQTPNKDDEDEDPDLKNNVKTYLSQLKKRNIIFPYNLKRNSAAKSKNAEFKPSTFVEHSEEDLISGKLPIRLVKAIHDLAQQNDNFREYVWPSLKGHKIGHPFPSGDSHGTGSEIDLKKLEGTDQILKQILQNINAFIERQVRAKTCIPLRPELQKFYDEGVKIGQENAEKKREKAKSKSRRHQSHALKRSVSDEPLIRQKYGVVKKLLNDYNTLPKQDQEKIKDTRDFLQMHLSYLNEIQLNQNRRKKRRVGLRFDDPALVIPKNGSTVSSKYLRLVRTAQTIQRNSLKKPNGFVSDYEAFSNYEYF